MFIKLAPCRYPNYEKKNGRIHHHLLCFLGSYTNHIHKDEARQTSCRASRVKLDEHYGRRNAQNVAIMAAAPTVMIGEIAGPYCTMRSDIICAIIRFPPEKSVA
jgi:hypothetical protein